MKRKVHIEGEAIPSGTEKKVRIFGIVRILGKARIIGAAIPIWLLVFAVIVAGAGAAIGTIIVGQIRGEVPVTVSQALCVGEPVFVADDTDWINTNPVMGITGQTLPNNHYLPDRYIGSASDDCTAFQAAAEVDTGDLFLILLPLENASNEDLIAELTLDIPDGITVECFSVDQESGSTHDYTQSLTRTGLNTWKFKLLRQAEKTVPSSTNPSNWDDSIGIVVALSDTIQPGSYIISGDLKQVSY